MALHTQAGARHLHPLCLCCSFTQMSKQCADLVPQIPPQNMALHTQAGAQMQLTLCPCVSRTAHCGAYDGLVAPGATHASRCATSALAARILTAPLIKQRCCSNACMARQASLCTACRQVASAACQPNRDMNGKALKSQAIADN